MVNKSIRIAALLVAITSQSWPPAAHAQADPKAPADGEIIVLLTVQPKNPFSGHHKIAYVKPVLSESEARQHMRTNWIGPAAVHPTEVYMPLLSDFSLMTRQRLVESTLASYEKMGGRSAIRVDVLNAGGQPPTLPVGTSQ